MENREQKTFLMKGLIGSPGWKLFIEEIENSDVKRLTERLLKGEYETIEDRNRDKDKLEFFKTLEELPEMIILNNIPAPKEDSMEVY